MDMEDHKSFWCSTPEDKQIECDARQKRGTNKFNFAKIVLILDECIETLLSWETA